MHRKYQYFKILAAAIIGALRSFRRELRGYVQADAANRNALRFGRLLNVLIA